MNDAEFNEISKFVYLLADKSKKITLEGFYSNLDPKTKKDGSPVTQYDIKAEKIICDLIYSSPLCKSSTEFKIFF